MDETMTADILQVSPEENECLTESFTEKEVREAVFQMKHNKSPGPDGFPAEFYQVFWSLIKNDLMAMFVDFHYGQLPIFSLNFGIITLIPKLKEVKMVQQYRPICMLNVSFKIFTKVLANRFTEVANRTIKPTQTAFLPGRYILEGVVILHETIHELKRKKQSGVILKLDFEKAYDKVSWSFLQQALRMKGFSQTWCTWIEKIVSKGCVGVQVNDDIGHFFQTKKGLRQGDPLSPLLFNIVADMLAVLISRAKNNDQFRGLVPHLIDGGLSVLQYADDTILFMENDLDQARNLRLVLNTFEKLSGLKINFHKSELFCFGEAKENVRHFVQIFGCKEGSFPFKYLGIPMNTHKLRNKDWKEIEERFQKKLASWKGKLLSAGGRLVLINSVLSSLPMFMMSFFRIPKGVLKRLNYYRSRFYWQCDEHKKKYRLSKWSILCQPKSLGGLGILNLEIQNICLLSKWLFKLLNEDGVWQNLLRKKYLKDKALTQVSKKPGDSQFWTGLMEIKDSFLSNGCFKVNNGEQTRFWEDKWVGGQSLKSLYPSLYNITRKKNVTVASVLSTVPLNVSFRRALVGNNLNLWLQLVERVMLLEINEQKDNFRWKLNKNGDFSVKSYYKELMRGGQHNTCKNFGRLRFLKKLRYSYGT
jgi:hypothetical protein